MRIPAKHEILEELSSFRPDEFRDPKACYEGEPLSEVSDLLGKSVFLRPCGCEPFLVELSELELFRGFDDFAYLGRLAGMVKWGHARWETVNINRTKFANEKGFEKIDSFDNIVIGVPGSPYQFRFDQMRFHSLRTNGYNLASITRVDGIDLIDGVTCNWQVEVEQQPLCSMVCEWWCVNWACSRSCQVIEDGTELGDCNCPGWGFCAWWEQPRCVPVTCPRSCKLTGIFILSCDCPSARRA